MDVRPQPLTPYVQAPFERTSTEPWTYVHSFFCRRNWRSVAFCLHLFTFWSRVFANSAWFTCFYCILRAFTNVKKIVKYKKNRSKWHLWISSMGEKYKGGFYKFPPSKGLIIVGWILLPHLRLGIIQTGLASALAARSVDVLLSFGFFSTQIVS